jgi:hypothetical protein
MLSRALTYTKQQTQAGRQHEGNMQQQAAAQQTGTEARAAGNRGVKEQHPNAGT